MKRLSVSITDPEMVQLDEVLAASGETKAAFVRRAIREAILLHYVDAVQASVDPETDWRKVRGL